MTSFDVIVIGAGHNGMTAAAVLAGTGRRVLVLEAADEVGGMARDHELAAGFRVPAAAHLLSRLDGEVVRALALDRHGLNLGPAVPTVGLDGDGEHLVMEGAYGADTAGLAAGDAERWQDLRRRLLFQASILKRFLHETPPRPDAGGRDVARAAGMAALDLKRAGREAIQDFLRMILIAVADVVEEDLLDDRLRGLVAFDATLGICLGPRSPTSLLGLLYRLTGGTAGVPGAQTVPAGGMAAVMQAFRRSAEAAGAAFRTGTMVGRILVERGRIAGVVTGAGEEIGASLVLSAISPVSTFCDLVDPRELDIGFLRDIRTLRIHGNVAKLNLCLDRPPDFPGLAPAHRAARMVFAPSVDHVERSFNPSKYRELAAEPVFELVMPSATDPASAPDGAAILSVIIANTPYALKDGWERGRAALQSAMLERLERLAPGLRRSVIASELLTPADIEARFHAPGGHWHHGELQADRLFVLRPVFGAADYRAPIDGLYLCGAGTHPGGGICGVSGLNAARELIADGGWR